MPFYVKADGRIICKDYDLTQEGSDKLMQMPRELYDKLIAEFEEHKRAMRAKRREEAKKNGLPFESSTDSDDSQDPEQGGSGSKKRKGKKKPKRMIKTKSGRLIEDPDQLTEYEVEDKGPKSEILIPGKIGSKSRRELDKSLLNKGRKQKGAPLLMDLYKFYTDEMQKEDSQLKRKLNTKDKEQFDSLINKVQAIKEM
jgi:hypothetical protein